MRLLQHTEVQSLWRLASRKALGARMVHRGTKAFVGSHRAKLLALVRYTEAQSLWRLTPREGAYSTQKRKALGGSHRARARTVRLPPKSCTAQAHRTRTLSKVLVSAHRTKHTRTITCTCTGTGKSAGSCIHVAPNEAPSNAQRRSTLIRTRTLPRFVLSLHGP